MVLVIVKSTVFIQQVVVNAEAVSDSWKFNENQLNSIYQGGSLDTYGVNIGDFIAPVVNASVGYYYQISDMKEGSGLLRRLAYEIKSAVN